MSCGFGKAFEIGNALSAIVKRKQLTADEALTALQLARAIPVRLVNPDISKSLQIVLTFNIYVCDAYFYSLLYHLAAHYLLWMGE